MTAPAALKATRAALLARWPLAFDGQPRPLAIGVGKIINEQLLAAGFQRWAIGVAMHEHVSTRRYLMALAGGGMRIDLDGEPCGTIADAEKEHAAARLDARYPGWRGDA